MNLKSHKVNVPVDVPECGAHVNDQNGHKFGVKSVGDEDAAAVLVKFNLPSDTEIISVGLNTVLLHEITAT